MPRFILRRLAYMVFAFFAATIIVFGLSRMRGDPRLLYIKPGGYGTSPEQWAALGKQMGLDKPLVVQYFLWAGKILRGNLGRTIVDETPVYQVLRHDFPNTLQLALAALLYGTIVGIPVGVLSAVKRGSIWDQLGRAYALFGLAVPDFWIGLMGILLFGVKMGWLPTGGKADPGVFPLTWENIRYFIMPSIVLGFYPAASFMRITRTAMLEVLDSEYVKFARSKGVNEWVVLWKHAFKNAMIQPLTLMAIQLASFLGGAVVVEVVFSWPGIGRVSLEALTNNDFPLLTACVLLFVILYTLATFLSDIAYAYIDPRIRFT